MPINNITQTISILPPAGRRGVDVQTQFVIKQEDFQDHLQGTTVTELNTLKDQLNSRIGEINSTTTTMNGYADTASAGASTATTKAGEASTSAGEALTYRNQAETFKINAATSATSASASASTATTQASTATTKASEASASATSASTSASTATTQASTATTKADEASASATSASASASTATTQASTATTKADEASASATSAGASASTATTQAGIATTFAQQAQASATSVDVNNIVHRTDNETIAGVKTFSSTISGSINGNAATATKLATARTINGVSFDGTANIVAPTNLGITAGTTAGPIVTSSTGTNATLPTASASASGVVTTGDQTWGGVKTFSSNIVGNITGNSGTATKLSTTRTNYKGTTDSVVAGELMWKKYGNNHTIIDASDATSPNGTAIDAVNSNSPWAIGHPTLMGFNGGGTYGVRVDSSRYADQLKTARTINGVAFDGSTNITVGDSTAVKLTAFTGANANFGGNGYQKLPNGLIIQWGTYSGVLGHATSYTAILPIAFPSYCIKVLTQYGNTTVSTLSGTGYAKIEARGNSSFTFQWGWFSGGSAQVDVDYIAIGC